MLFPLPRYDRL
jgi:hypothetical protein